MKGKKDKKKDISDFLAGSNDASSVVLSNPADFLRRFAHRARPAIKTSVRCTQPFAQSSEPGEIQSAPDENWVLAAFGFPTQSYAACAQSTSDGNMAKCSKQFSVCESYANYHLRYELTLKQAPMKAISTYSDSLARIRQEESMASIESDNLASKAESLHSVKDVQGLLAAAVSCGPNWAQVGMNDQAHRLQKALLNFEPSKFNDGTFP